MNLSRFDGHTPGDWHELMMQGNEYDNGYLDLQNLGFNEAAIDLIADAPLLLAEVKRLREEIHEMGITLHDLGYRWDDETGEMYHRDDTRRDD